VPGLADRPQHLAGSHVDPKRRAGDVERHARGKTHLDRADGLFGQADLDQTSLLSRAGCFHRIQRVLARLGRHELGTLGQSHAKGVKGPAETANRQLDIGLETPAIGLDLKLPDGLQDAGGFGGRGPLLAPGQLQVASDAHRCQQRRGFGGRHGGQQRGPLRGLRHYAHHRDRES